MCKINILFAGDFCIRGSGVNNLYDEKIDEISSVIKNITSQYDVSMLNVETVFTDEISPVRKSGPNLSSPVKAVELLKKMGFTIGALANNHICDQGADKGAISVEMVKDIGMYTVGCGKNLNEANTPVRIEKNGKKLSFLNFAENEFTAATESTFGFAPVDYYNNAKLIKEEKENSDFVFVMLHAGNEHCPFPRSGIKKLTHHFIDSGADAVIIAHPHTPQGYEYYNGKPIVYSMGNFFMSKELERKTLWNIGYMVSLAINEDNSIEIEPIPFEFGAFGEYFKFLTGAEKERFITYLNELCEIVKCTSNENYKRLEYAWSILYMKEAWEGYLKDMSSNMSAESEFMLFVKNAFCCESHQEVMQNFFTLLTTGRLNDFEAEKQKIMELKQLPY